MREDQDAAAVMGINILRTKLLAFTIGASFAGIGGAIFAARQGSIFPENFPYTIEESIKKTNELIVWLYKNQSQQQRKHMKNRLFIVLYSSDGEHWKLKSEIAWLKKRIEKYMKGFNPHYLLKFPLEQNHQTLSDVIWAIKS